MIDAEYDVELIDDGVCHGCRMAPSGPKSQSGLCNRCWKEVKELSGAGGAPEQHETDVAKAAKQEMGMRELARRRLIPYTQYLLPDYHAGWFHNDLGARLERFLKRVIAGDRPKLAINCPPRIGKSELSSKKFISWALGGHPWLRIIAATHSDRLAMDNSRDVLTDFASSEHRAVFPKAHLRPDAKGTTGWRTTQGGMYKPVGVGGGIAGYGAHILDIDDPHRDQEAYSAVVRERVWNWFKSSARTRLLPGGGILLVQTRWVKDDLTGRLIEEEGLIEEGGEWELVRYPAEAEHDEYRLPTGRVISIPHPRAKLLRRKGELLHPERYSEDDYKDLRADPVVWAGLYQQDPTSGDAGHFTEDMFEKSACKLADIPTTNLFYTTWDTGQSQKEKSDYTVEITATLDKDDVLWITNVRRSRWEPDDLIDAMIDGWLETDSAIVGVEKTNFIVGLKPALEKRLEERGVVGFPLQLMEHGNKDKVTRAAPIKARMRMGKVRIPTDAPWYETFKQELEEFAGGRHDDQVDAFAYIGQLLLDMGTLPAPVVKPKKSWRDKLKSKTPSRGWMSA